MDYEQDQDLAKAVKYAATELTKAISLCEKEGLSVKISIQEVNMLGSVHPKQYVSAYVNRQIKV